MMPKTDYKIVIIGESMVGKTSILLRYTQGKFIKIREEDRTVNTNCFKQIINMNNMTFSINIWDTAGEEKYHAMAPIFYRGADGAVIVFDVNKRESFELAGKWFEELNNFADNNPKIILVGNKVDLDKREVPYNQARELADKYKGLYLDVSALTGQNINEIFNNLTTDIYYHKISLMRKNTTNKKKGVKINTGLTNNATNELGDNNSNNNKKPGKSGCC